MSERDHPARATEGFFGRRRGKSLRQAQAEALAGTLPRLGLDLSKAAPTDLRSLFEAPVEDVRIEIGFGGGERLLPAVRANATTGFIGVEPFVNGMAKLVAAISADEPKNLRLYDDDAIQLLDWLPAASVAAIDLFYPDPWPKRRHWKRRFVNPGNLGRFARVLRPGGVFRFASDIDHYVDWTLLAFGRHPAFAWTARSADDWRQPYADWTRTRYEAKAVREGRRSAYLTFERT